MRKMTFIRFRAEMALLRREWIFLRFPAASNELNATLPRLAPSE